MTKIISGLVDRYYALLAKEPARLLGVIAAAITAVAGVLEAGGVKTWQAALPVLLAEGIRRLVNSPATLTAFGEMAYELGIDEATFGTPDAVAKGPTEGPAPSVYFPEQINAVVTLLDRGVSLERAVGAVASQDLYQALPPSRRPQA